MKQSSLLALTVATVASIGGTRFSAIAIPWLVLTTTNSPMLTGLVGLMFERIPKRVVGRGVALVGSLTWALIPFGGIYAGLLVDTMGIAGAMATTAGLYLVATLAPTIIPQFRVVRSTRA